MRKITQTIVGTTPPLDKNVIWLDSTDNTAPVEKVFINGQWTPMGIDTDDYYTKEEVNDKLDEKLDVIETPVNGNLIAMDSQGQAIDSGKKTTDFIATPTDSGSEGEVLSVDSEGNPVWTTVTPTGTADTEMSDTSTNAVQNKVIKEYVDGNFARQNGWYDTLVSGAAKNLVGHGTTPAEYTFRTSGGNADIGTGTATIDMMKGKTLKFHQSIPNGDFSQGTDYWTGNNASISVVDGRLEVVVSAANGGARISKALASENKYYLSFQVESPINESSHSWIYFGNNSVAKWHYAKGENHISNILSPTQDLTGPMWIRFNDVNTFYLDNVMLINLTTMFGAGNEPTTPEEFEALYPLDYYDYTATPVLINNAASGIVTTGFNQWDEQWERGDWTTVDGVLTKQNTGGYSNYRIRNVNPIPCLPNTTYYAKAPALIWVFAVDENMNKVGLGNIVTNNTFSTPQNAKYLCFQCGYDTSPVTTYNNNICINLSWSGYRNGEYEPYEKHTLYFNGESGSLATLTGKKIVDGEPTGESVTIFPDGMKSAGSVYDFGKAESDGYIRKVTKKLGSVDLGTLTWAFITSSGYNIFESNDKSDIIKKTTSNSIDGSLLCAKYPTLRYNGVRTDGVNSVGVSADGTIGIKDLTKNSTAIDSQGHASFLEGVILYYELATPEEYLLDTPIPANYIVNDFGTEQRIPVDTASSVMSPLNYTVAYAQNTVDTVRRLGINYIKKESMDHILTAFKTAGIIADYTLTYDATNDDYTCSIEAPTPGE